MPQVKDFSVSAGTIMYPAEYVGVDIPNREWLVKDLIPHKTVTLLSGDGGLGKTLLMQQLMTSIATGSKWLGLETFSGKAFALLCEDSNEELLRRQSSICESIGVPLEACYNMCWLSGNGIDPTLMDFSKGDHGGLMPLFDDLMKFLEYFSPDLIIIDTAADTFAGNEISRAHVRNFINRCLKVMAEKLEAAVILTSHPSRAGMSDGSGMSGSTAWNNSVRSRLYLTRPNGERDPNARILEMKKSNYGSSEHQVKIIWQEGVFKEVDSTLNQSPEQRNLQDERAYLLALEKLNDRGEKVLLHQNQTNYGPKIMKKVQEANGVSKARLEAAQERLFDRGVIANLEEAEGPPSKRKRHIQILDQEQAKSVIDLMLF